MTGTLRMIMITGVQRSGTTVLYDSLAEDSSLRSIPESSDNELFLGWDLRREKEIRSFLRGSERTILTKPVNETINRTLINLIQEYQVNNFYDLQLIFIYRNPVNVFFSRLMKRLWEEKSLDGYKVFIEEWNARNKKVLNALPDYREQIALVRYEDLIGDEAVFQSLCEKLEIRGKYLFREDSRAGELYLHPPVAKAILDGTRETMEQLNHHRSYVLS